HRQRADRATRARDRYGRSGARAAQGFHSARRHAKGRGLACGSHCLPPRRASRRASAADRLGASARHHLLESTVRFVVRFGACGESSCRRRRSHVVTIASGLIHDLQARASRVAPAHRYAIITDTNVAGIYREYMAFGSVVMIPAGERYKTRESWASVTDEMLAQGFGRDSAIIAV